MYFNMSVFGGLRSAMLRPLYRRAKYGGQHLDTDITAALDAFEDLLDWAPPRSLPFTHDEVTVPIMYADAYFEVGGLMHRFGDWLDYKRNAPTDSFWANCANGFGVIVIERGFRACFEGSIPS